MSADFNTNVLILGKTGAGKSTLLNYLYGQNMVIGKAGSPETLKGFHKQQPFTYRGLAITVYDSWGLEADKTQEWRGLLREELERVDALSVRDWFHTVIYCLDAKASRLDDFEKREIIEKLLEGGVRLIFALTKWDLCSVAEKEAAIDLVTKNYPSLDYVPICSISKKLRNGTVTKPQGREDLFCAMCLNLRTNLVAKTHRLAREKLNEALEKAQNKVLEYYDEETGPLGVFTYYDDELLDKMQKKALKVYPKKSSEVAAYLNDNYAEINALCSQVIASYTGKTIDIEEFQNIIAGEIFQTGIEAWDNTWAEDFATIITTFLSGGLFQFAKKSLYKDKLKAGLKKISERLRQRLQEWIDDEDKTENRLKTLYLQYLKD